MLDLNALAPKTPSRRELIAPVTAFLRTLNERQATDFFAPRDLDRLLKSTVSLCPECLAYVPALVYESHGRVLMKKYCRTHRFHSAVLENSARHYHLSNKDVSGVAYATDRVFRIPQFSGPCCEGGSCGPAVKSRASGQVTDQSANKTCVILVEVTNACNLQCKVCYADAKGDRFMPLAEFKLHIRTLVASRGGLDSMQITGGEAILHPQFWEMLAYCYGIPEIKKIYLPTNGLEFSKPEVAARLRTYRDRLLVLLQFDSERPEANRALRAAHPAEVRRRAVANLAAQGIFMQLTMTLVKGVNESDIGWLIRTAFRTPQVKVVAFQPATYSGRFEAETPSLDRLTLSDIVTEIEAQTAAMRKEADFIPIPCSHPQCGWVTLYARRFGLAKNIMKYIDLEAAMSKVAYKTLLSSREIQSQIEDRRGGIISRAVTWLGRNLVRAEDVLTIAVKPFMDRMNYDQDRIANCCHHIMTTTGEVASFCEYNAVVRPRDSWSRFPTKGQLAGDQA